MREIPLPDPPQLRPESSQEDLEEGRLTSIVYIMRGRSPFSHLGILDLQAGSLSLRDAKGGQLFAVPVETVRVRLARRKFFETRRPGFEVHANGVSDEAYLRLTRNPTQHQALWGGYWLSVLGRAGSS